jgi:hypothetical protein
MGYVGGWVSRSSEIIRCASKTAGAARGAAPTGPERRLRSAWFLRTSLRARPLRPLPGAALPFPILTRLALPALGAAARCPLLVLLELLLAAALLLLLASALLPLALPAFALTGLSFALAAALLGRVLLLTADVLLTIGIVHVSSTNGGCKSRAAVRSSVSIEPLQNSSTHIVHAG